MHKVTLQVGKTELIVFVKEPVEPVLPDLDEKIAIITDSDYAELCAEFEDLCA